MCFISLLPNYFEDLFQVIIILAEQDISFPSTWPIISISFIIRKFMENYGDHNEEGERLNVLKIYLCLKNEYVLLNINIKFITKFYGILATIFLKYDYFLVLQTSIWKGFLEFKRFRDFLLQSLRQGNFLYFHTSCCSKVPIAF